MNLNPETKNSPLQIRLTEIGRVHSPFKQATGTPIQPTIIPCDAAAGWTPCRTKPSWPTTALNERTF
jgi:hypothetical protein